MGTPAVAGLTPLEVLDRPPGLRDLFAYPRFAGASWTRGPVAVCLGFAAAIAASVAVGWGLIQLLGPDAPAVMLLIPAGWVLMALVGWIWWSVDYVRRVRIARFAAASGFGYVDRQDDERRPGLGFPMHLRTTETCVVYGHVAGHGFELGRNRSTSARSDRADVRRPFWFVELTLPSHVPHIVLKNRRSRVLSTVGLGIGSPVKLGLEGDFDRTFTLLCPAGYERDALYVFTPNVMAALLDAAGDAEVELVDDRLYAYFRTSTPVWRASGMRRVLALVEAIGDRITTQTQRYVDDRAEGTPLPVALAGRRILGGSGATGLTVVTVALVVAWSAALTAFTLWGVPWLGSP